MSTSNIATEDLPMHGTADREPSAAERQEWESEFAAAALRPLAVRLRYAFIRTYKPVLDDAPYRPFERMADYRQWCDTQLPFWLGYGRI